MVDTGSASVPVVSFKNVLEVGVEVNHIANRFPVRRLPAATPQQQFLVVWSRVWPDKALAQRMH